MTASDLFVSGNSAEWKNPEPGVTRRIMAYLPEMMMVEVVFEKDAVGALHSHPHIQASYVAEGSFEVTIDGRTETLHQEEASSFLPTWSTGSGLLPRVG